MLWFSRKIKGFDLSKNRFSDLTINPQTRRLFSIGIGVTALFELPFSLYLLNWLQIGSVLAWGLVLITFGAIFVATFVPSIGITERVHQCAVGLGMVGTCACMMVLGFGFLPKNVFAGLLSVLVGIAIFGGLAMIIIVRKTLPSARGELIHIVGILIWNVVVTIPLVLAH